MEDEVCVYSKFGYCKYKEKCKRKHFYEDCEHLHECSDIKRCEKRHPKRCKKYASGNTCRFKNDCAYSHKKSVESQEKDMLKEKVNSLEKTVSEMVIKLINFEKELNEIKKDQINKEKIENKVQNSEKIKDTSEDAASKDENLKKVLEMKVDSSKCKGKISNTKDSKKSVFVFGAEARKSVLEVKKSEEIKKSSSSLKCDQCDYNCERPNTLKKHINTKHTVQKCSLCSQEFTISMDLLSHIAKEHHDGEDVCSLNLQSTPKSGKEKTDFVVDESMLNEFL